MRVGLAARAGIVLALAVTGGAVHGLPGASANRGGADPLRDEQWALDAIHVHATRHAGGPDGAGAIVAVVDSGVDATHPDLAGRVIAGPDLVDGDGDPSDPTGHGTHVAGLIAAGYGNGVGGAGVAPGARILAVRVLDRDNRGTAANVAAGVDAAVHRGAHVINLSLNLRPDDTDALAAVRTAMERAADAGVLVVVGAGNNGQEACEEPVPLLRRHALCVGALGYDLRLSNFSSHGRGLGLVAPGEDLLSTWPGNGHRNMSGTSQAAALASGVGAVLAGLGVRGDELARRLVASAREIGPAASGRRQHQHGHPGAGLLDADRAIHGARQRRLFATLRIDAPPIARSADLLREGLHVGCDAARPGRCRARLSVGSTVIAKGSAIVDGTDIFDVLAAPTAAGRRLLGGGRRLRGVLALTLAGAPDAHRRVTLLPRLHGRHHRSRPSDESRIYR
ncbi:MAG TPA: S8 family serine peptidase [Solirubrobacteraceae bacterium]|jgi:hypothetical protein|nr:S8 family serine peptidase [Solirubrobacteraceae bacterium]